MTGWLRGDGAAPAIQAEAGWLLSRDDLLEAVATTAERLGRSGVGAGTVVAVALPSRPDLVVAVLAVLELGGLVLALDTLRWPRELRAAVELSRPDLVLAQEAVTAELDDLAPTIAIPTPTGPGPAVGAAGRVRATAHGDRNRDPDRDRDRDRDRDGSTDGDRGELVCATAGLWGEPQLFTFAADQLAAGWTEPADGEPGDLVLATGVAQAAGLRMALATLAAGGRVRLVERWVGRRVLEGLAQRPADRLFASGPQLNELATTVSTRGAGGARAATLDVSGGRLFPRAATSLGTALGAQLVPRYALTEAGGWATVGPPRSPADHHPLDVGRPANGVDVTLLSLAEPSLAELSLADGGSTSAGQAVLAAGIVGSVLVSGEATARGRVGAGHVTTPGPWPAGDLARRRPDGGLDLIGRVADRFRSRGCDVDPVLVELALARHPGVADVAVAPRPDPHAGWLAVAVTVPSDPVRPPFLAELEGVLDDVEPGARPRAQAVVDRLPLTPGGLVHRRMLAYDEAAR